jgi:hypothetical protein
LFVLIDWNVHLDGKFCFQKYFSFIFSNVAVIVRKEKQPDEVANTKMTTKKSLLHWAGCVAEFFPGMISKAVRLERAQRLESKSRGTSGEAGRASERKAHGFVSNFSPGQSTNN